MLRRIMLGSGLAVLLLAAGLPAAQAQYAVAPPPPREEVVPPPPGERYVWRPGHWHWDFYRNTYVWRPGQYVLRPHRALGWVPGHWEQRDGVWVWRHGHWRFS